jgi:zinc finger protein
MSASIPFTIILDDPLSNSYIQNLYAPDADPGMITEEYTRSHFQNEELGLNDMDTAAWDHPVEDDKVVLVDGEEVVVKA